MNERDRKIRRYVISGVAVVAAFVACTDGGENYSLVQDCIEDYANDAGCEGGFPYTCMSGSLPSDSDPTLVCQGGSPGANGSITFCCGSSSASSSGCNTTDQFACPESAIAYACTGANSPSAGDPTLACEAYGSDNDYCCIADGGTTSPSCTLESDAGCASGGPIAYVCPSGATPDTIDPTLSCGAPTALSNGFASYCCSN